MDNSMLELIFAFVSFLFIFGVLAISFVQILGYLIGSFFFVIVHSVSFFANTLKSIFKQNKSQAA